MAWGTAAVPVLIPSTHGDFESLVRAAAAAAARRIECLLDPVLDPIHSGFTTSLLRYAHLREVLPTAEILMGTGNLTELTEADSPGVTALLVGMCSELAIHNVLIVQVTPHAPHRRGARLGAPGHVRGTRQCGSGARFTPPGCCTARPPTIDTDRRRRRRACFGRARSQHPHRRRRGRHARLQPGISRSRRHRDGLFPRPRREQDGAHAFYLGSELAKPRWHGGSASATCRTSRSTGAAPPRAGRGAAASSAARTHADGEAVGSR